MIRNALGGLGIVILAIWIILAGFGFSPADIAGLFAHPVQGGTGLAMPPAAPTPAAPEEAPRPFGTANSVALAVYLAAMLAIGVFAGRRTRSTRAYFIADGRLHYAAVGISILATYLSALSVMGLSGAAFGAHDWTYMIQLPFLIITAMVITGFVLPRYRAAGIVSIYAFLEQRLHVSARLLASASFILFCIGRLGLLLYLPALAFSTATGVPLWLCIVVIGIVTTIYTVMGGIEAVIWTDVVQAVVLSGMAIYMLAFIFQRLGIESFLAVGMAYNKFRIVAPSLDVRRITTLWLILETVVQTIRIYGTQQDVAQRYMTTESTAKANRSVWIGILSYIPLAFVFYLTGTALFVFYKLYPDIPAPAKADSIVPHFALHYLPPGAAGLIIAAIFAAAMSSIDSAMNSASAVCVEDFARRFRIRARSDGHDLRLARRLTLAWGILGIASGLAFMNIQYAQIFWGKLMAVTTNGILGLMALAFLPFRVRPAAALAGFAASTGALLAMVLRSGINFLLWPVIGNAVCFVVALAAHALLGKKGSVAPHD